MIAQWKVVLSSAAAVTIVPLAYFWCVWPTAGVSRQLPSTITDVVGFVHGRNAFVATANDGVFKLSTADLEVEKQYPLTLRDVGPIAVSSELAILAAGQAVLSRTGNVETRELATGALRWVKPLHDGPVYGLDFCIPEQWLVSCGHDGLSDFGSGGDIAVTDARTGVVMARLSELHSMPTRVVAAGGGSRFAVQFWDGTVRGWACRSKDEGIDCMLVEDLDLSGTRDLCRGANSNELWILLETRCLVYDWENASLRELKLPIGIELDSISTRHDQQGIVGVRQGRVIWFDRLGDSLVECQSDHAWWARRTAGTADPRTILAFGDSIIGRLQRRDKSNRMRD